MSDIHIVGCAMLHNRIGKEYPPTRTQGADCAMDARGQGKGVAMMNKGLIKWIVAGAIALSAGTVVAGTVHKVKHSTTTHKAVPVVSTSHKATPTAKHTTATPKKASTVSHNKKTTLAVKKPVTHKKLTTKTVKTPTKLTTHTTHTNTKATPPKKTYSHPLPVTPNTPPSRDKTPWVY